MARIPDSPIPVSNENPEGMQILYGDRQESFGAEMIPDIEYVRYGDRAMRLHLLTPLAARLNPRPDGFPTVVFVQGSGWGVQKLYMNIPQLSELAHHGFIVASIEYRPCTEAVYPAQIQDVKTAIRYLRKHAAQYMIDPQRIAVCGDSSGGHTALMVGLTHGDPMFDTPDYADQDSAVCAIIDIYGVTNFQEINRKPREISLTVETRQSIEEMVLGTENARNPDFLQRINPTYYAATERKLPPVLILHGDSDPIVPFNQSVLLYNTLREHGHQALLYKVLGGMHGTRFWSRELFDLMARFLYVYI